MEVAPGIVRIGRNSINFYLIEDRGKIAVIDSGFPKMWDLLTAALSARGRSLADIDAVLLTHAHQDHYGGAERLRREANARVLIHPSDADVAGGRKRPRIPNIVPYLFNRTAVRYFAACAREGAMRVPAVKELAMFGDGEVLDVPGRPRVVFTPGHSPGHCSLLLEDRDVLFAGDALITVNPVRTGVGPTLGERMFSEDYDTAYASLDVLEPLRASVILPGHGDPWHGSVADAVKIARATR
jgi:glyoxylase-like metal-dependent hydrolase (beta-lactamase superfamily II)